MTNRELQDELGRYPDDVEIRICSGNLPVVLVDGRLEKTLDSPPTWEIRTLMIHDESCGGAVVRGNDDGTEAVAEAITGARGSSRS